MFGKNFILRSLSGIAIAAVTVGAILWSVHSLLGLAIVIAVFSLGEFYRLAFDRGEGPMLKKRNLFPVFCAVYLIVLSYLVFWYGLSPDWFLTVFPLLFGQFIIEMYRCRKDPIRQVSVQWTGIFYIAVPLSMLVDLGIEYNSSGEAVYDSLIVLFYVLLIWVNDVGAYLVGMSVGKRRLFPRLSPKKSWEGFWGGVLLTIAASACFGYYIEGAAGYGLLLWVLTGAIVAFAAVAGDLVESMMKRAVGVKDSGRAIPGHGGFLDRFDAMLFSLPFAYVLIKTVV